MTAPDIDAIQARAKAAYKIRHSCPTDVATEDVHTLLADRNTLTTRVAELEKVRVPGHYGPYSPGDDHDQARIAEIQLMHGPCDPLQCGWKLLLADRDRLDAEVRRLRAELARAQRWAAGTLSDLESAADQAMRDDDITTLLNAIACASAEAAAATPAAENGAST